MVMELGVFFGNNILHPTPPLYSDHGPYHHHTHLLFCPPKDTSQMPPFLDGAP